MAAEARPEEAKSSTFCWIERGGQNHSLRRTPVRFSLTNDDEDQERSEYAHYR